jgi:hypothetical protein
MYNTYMQEKVIPQSRGEIRALISAEYGGMADYCLKNRWKYTVVTNMLRGFTPHQRHPEIAQKINKDTGASLEAWAK